MTFEKRIERLKKNLSKDEKIIGIYEDEHAYKCYGGHMDPWCNDRYMVYPVSYNREIETMGSLLAGHSSAIFFGTQFLNDDDFKTRIIRTLESLEYDSKRIKIIAYQIVN